MEDEAATDARKTLTQLTAAIESHWGSDLLGLYLFGSLAGGGFYAGKSDLDVMAVVTAGVEEGQQLEELRVSMRRSLPNALRGSNASRSCMSIATCSERSPIVHGAASQWSAPANHFMSGTLASSPPSTGTA